MKEHVKCLYKKKVKIIIHLIQGLKREIDAKGKEINRRNRRKYRNLMKSLITGSDCQLSSRVCEKKKKELHHTDYAGKLLNQGK